MCSKKSLKAMEKTIHNNIRTLRYGIMILFQCVDELESIHIGQEAKSDAESKVASRKNGKAIKQTLAKGV